MSAPKVIDLMAVLTASLREHERPMRSATIEVVEKHHDLLGCRVNGHRWQPDESSSGAEYICIECSALGNMVRPMGAQR